LEKNPAANRTILLPRSKPSWYIFAKNDHTLNPYMERFVAKRMGAVTTEVVSRHVAMLSTRSWSST
jgi:hypothetical protein